MDAAALQGLLASMNLVGFFFLFFVLFETFWMTKSFESGSNTLKIIVLFMMNVREHRGNSKNDKVFLGRPRWRSCWRRARGQPRRAVCCAARDAPEHGLQRPGGQYRGYGGPDSRFAPKFEFKFRKWNFAALLASFGDVNGAIERLLR